MSTPCDVVWFKRDLRLQDHAPLAEAVDSGRPMLLLYILEPSLLKDQNHSERHTRFILESIDDLNRQLHEKGTRIYAAHAEAEEVFAYLQQAFGVHTVYSHEETGLRVTYDRDRALAKWLRERGIVWKEFQNNGVERGRHNRQDWSKRWHQFMNQELREVAWHNARWVDTTPEFPGTALPETAERPVAMQPGGETTAHRYLQSFLYERGANYSKHISKPEFSRQSCSRLSPYLAWGNLSIRQVYQAYRQVRAEVKHKKPLAAFATRLRWHCHFIQKFEMEDRMEFEPYNNGYTLLEKEFKPDWFEAWKSGTTGYPLVDACMRAVRETGYLNFRMRAMVVSFWTHHLWQPWEYGAVCLAQQFLDFEPGIHYAQFHMQAGATGINTVRIYNPVKQSQDHDPDGSFIHRWVPELQAVPAPYVHEPWKVPPLEQASIGFCLGEDYPHPIIDIKETGQHARKRLWSHRNHPLVRAESKRILQRHTMPNRQP